MWCSPYFLHLSNVENNIVSLNGLTMLTLPGEIGHRIVELIFG